MSNIIEGITKDLKAIPKNQKAKAGGMDTKKLVLLNLLYIFVGYFCDKVAWLWRVAEGTNASDKMMAVMNRFDKLFANPLPSFHPRDLLIGVAGGIALRLVVYYKAKNAKKFRQARSERPMRSTVVDLILFMRQMLFTVVPYLRAIAPSVSPDLMR